LDLKSIIPNWIKRNLTVLKEGEDPDHLYIECELVRALGEARQKAISNINLSKDFDKKLLLKLQDVEIESPNRLEMVVKFLNTRRPRNYILAGVMSVFLSSVLLYTTYNAISDNNKMDQAGSFPLTGTDLQDEKHVEAWVKKVGNSKAYSKILKEIENHYSSVGNHEKASMIHALLELENTSAEK
jgi:hypothetical protein